MPAKPLNHVIARSEATRQSLTERNGIPERNLEKQRETVCVLQARHHLLLSVSCSRASPRDAIPSTLRLPRPRGGLAMTRNWDVFCLNQAPFCQMQSLSIESLRRFPAKPLGHVIARSEATRQSLTERNGIPERNLEKQRETVYVLQARHHLLLSVSCSRASPRDAIPSALRNL